MSISDDVITLSMWTTPKNSNRVLFVPEPAIISPESAVFSPLCVVVFNKLPFFLKAAVLSGFDLSHAKTFAPLDATVKT